jgi:hypothetical protein
VAPPWLFFFIKIYKKKKKKKKKDLLVDHYDMYVGVSLYKLRYILPDGVNIYYLVKWLRP